MDVCTVHLWVFCTVQSDGMEHRPRHINPEGNAIDQGPMSIIFLGILQQLFNAVEVCSKSTIMQGLSNLEWTALAWLVEPHFDHTKLFFVIPCQARHSGRMCTDSRSTPFLQCRSCSRLLCLVRGGISAGNVELHGLERGRDGGRLRTVASPYTLFHL